MEDGFWMGRTNAEGMHLTLREMVPRVNCRRPGLHNKQDNDGAGPAECQTAKH
jgi:hypothetical protein